MIYTIPSLTHTYTCTHMILIGRNPLFGVLTSKHTTQADKLQKIARSLDFWIQKLERYLLSNVYIELEAHPLCTNMAINYVKSSLKRTFIIQGLFNYLVSKWP